MDLLNITNQIHKVKIKVLPPRTVEEILARERERKARTTLLMALLEDHLAKFHKMTDAKEMWEAIKSRFGGNNESKKMQKYILKQQFKGFSVSNSEGLHKGYDRTKPGVDSLSFDDLYNNLRVFENDVKGSTTSPSNTQNVAFVSENTISTNDVVPIQLYGVFSNPSSHNSYSDTEVTSCSNEYKESYAKLKKLYDEQRAQLSDASIEIHAYTQDSSEPTVNEPKVVSQPKVWFDAPIIEEYALDSEDEHVSLPTEEQETPSFANQQVKTPRETIKNQFINSKNPKVDKKGLGYGFVTKACFRAVGGKETLLSPQQVCKLETKDSTGLGTKYYKDNAHDWKQGLPLLNIKNFNVVHVAFRGRKGPTWLFDLDYLTDSMNYQPVRSENQANKHAGPQEANHNAGTEDIIDAGDSEKEAESAQDYFVLPIWSSYSSTVKRSTAKDAGEAPNKHPDLKTDEKPVDKEDQVFLDELERLKRQEQDANDAAEALRKEFAQETEDLLLQAGAAKSSSTNIVNTASTPVSTASPYGGLSFTDLTNPDPDDSEIPALEDIYNNPTDGIFTNSSYDNEIAVADFTNLEPVVNAPIPHQGLTLFILQLNSWRSTILVRTRNLPYGKKEIHNRRLSISWQETNFLAMQKADHVSTSTTEAENVVSCKLNPVYHSKTKHIAIRHHFIRDAYEKKLIQVLKIHTDDNVADLLTKAFDVSRRSPFHGCSLNRAAKHNKVAYWKRLAGNAETDLSPRPSPSTHIPDSIPKSFGGNHRGQSSSDKSLSGNEGDMTLQSVYDLCISLCTQVTDQAKEIKHLKAQIKKLKKKAKPIPYLNELPPDDTLDYMDTEDAQDVGRTRDVVNEEKESAEDAVSTEGVVSTDKEKVSTDRQKVSTDRPNVSTDRPKVNTDKEKDSTVSPDEGTDDQTEGRSATPTTPTTTPTMFRDDENIAQDLLNMSQAKLVSSNVHDYPVWGFDRLVIRAKVIENQIIAASAIAISSDSSDESVGLLPSRVILFGDIPTIIPSTSVVAPETSTITPVISSVAPVVETTLVASPTGLCGLVPYSDSDSDSPDEMESPKYITPLPATSPFLYTDSSEASDSSDGPPSQDLYVATVAHWRSRVTSRSPSPSDFPIAPVTAPTGTRRRTTILIRGRPYRTRPNRPRRVMTARKRVGPLPARRLAWRRVSPRSSDHRPSSSSLSSDSSPVHSSGLDAPDQAHSGSSTRDVSSRLCYPPRREPRRSEAFRRWCTALLSTLYPPTTLESSSGDSSERPLHSSSHSVGPSRKRCRSSVDSVPSSTPVMGSLAPTCVDLLPRNKRFKDSYSSEASIEEDTEVDLIETEVDMELGISDGDDVRDHVEIDPRDVRDDTEEYEADTSAGDTVEVGIDPMSAPIVEEEIVEPVGEDSSNSSGTRDGIVRSFKDMPIELDDVVCDFYHHMSEVYIDRIVRIETVQRRLEADQLITKGERARMIERIESLRLENLKVRAMLDIERDHVNSLRLHMSLSQEEFRQVRRDHDDTRGRLRRLESTMTNTRSGMTPAAIEEMINQRVDAALETRRVNRDLELRNGNDNGGGDGNGNGTGNGNNGGDNGDVNENRNVNERGDRPGAREWTYQDFMKCQPLSFKGT
ncbi:hypothetical protein Tco_1360475 [Tanacetum coccineum]